jgi:hypothetical protein
VDQLGHRPLRWQFLAGDLAVDVDIPVADGHRFAGQGDDPFCGVLACFVGTAKDDHLPAAGAYATRYGRSVDQQMVASCGCGGWQVVVMEPAQRAGDSRWGG